MSTKKPFSYAFSSVGKKQLMGLTGLFLCGFALSHLAGNFLLFAGPEAFNFYAHKLTSNPLIYVAEALLLGGFLVHIMLAMTLTIQNKQARPKGYYVKVKTGRGTTFASSTMPYTGMILLVFVILHLINFKYGAYYTATYEGEEIRDLYRVVIEYFANPTYTAWYVFAMICLGVHTSHGFQSAFQSLGFNHPKYTPTIDKLSMLYGLVVAVGFSALAVWSHFQN
jgi:succinate dehydrogenase / fumarate reductase cytochrome b subunit